MKSISKMLIAVGTGILFLICILIGVLYYRNLNRNEEEMAVTIEKNLKQYLNERVSELNPQILEQEGNDELIQEVLDHIVNNFMDDWKSQFIDEAGEVFISEEEYAVIGDEIFSSLQEELLKRLEQANGEEREKILSALEQLKTENSNGLKVIKEEIQNSISAAIDRIAAIEKKVSDMEGETQGTKESIVNVQNNLQILKDKINVKVERWDEESQTLYLIPVE